MKRIIASVALLGLLAVAAFGDSPPAAYSISYQPSIASDTDIETDINGNRLWTFGYDWWFVEIALVDTPAHWQEDLSNDSIWAQFSIWGTRTNDTLGNPLWDSIAALDTGSVGWDGWDGRTFEVPRHMNVVPGDSAWTYKRMKIRARWLAADHASGAGSVNWDIDSTFDKAPEFDISIVLKRDHDF